MVYDNRSAHPQESATNGEHIWFETNVSGDFCYVGEQYCIAKTLVSEWHTAPWWWS